MCWHKWNKWRDPELVDFFHGPVYDTYNVQERYCMKCNKVETAVVCTGRLHKKEI